MVRALFDTNILIDYLNGIELAAKELSLYQDRVISVITWMEVMAGERADANRTTRDFLSGFNVLPLSQDIAERAARIRRKTKLKLPDAVIQATAEAHGLLLVTRNTKDFRHDSPGVRIPYIH